MSEDLLSEYNMSTEITEFESDWTSEHCKCCFKEMQDLATEHRALLSACQERLYLKYILVERNKENEHLSKSLLDKKEEFDKLSSQMQRDFYISKVLADKQKIKLRHRINQYQDMWRTSEEKCNKYFSIVHDIDDIVRNNEKLKEELLKVKRLLKSISEHYTDLRSRLQRNLSCVIVEFSKEIAGQAV